MSLFPFLRTDVEMVPEEIKEDDTDPRKLEALSDAQTKEAEVEQQSGQEQNQNQIGEKEELGSGKDKNEEPSEDGQPKEGDTKGMLVRVLRSYLGGKDQVVSKGNSKLARASPLHFARALDFLSPFGWRQREHDGVDGKHLFVLKRKFRSKFIRISVDEALYCSLVQPRTGKVCFM